MALRGGTMTNKNALIGVGRSGHSLDGNPTTTSSRQLRREAVRPCIFGITFPRIHSRKGKHMTNVYIEARPKGGAEATLVIDYVIENDASQLLESCRTQDEAIEWARSQGHVPLVPLVRHLNDKTKPDHWRPAFAPGEATAGGRS
jgi:hypothetical protein